MEERECEYLVKGSLSPQAADRGPLLSGNGEDASEGKRRKRLRRAVHKRTKVIRCGAEVANRKKLLSENFF